MTDATTTPTTPTTTPTTPTTTPTVIDCECGEATGQACDWSGPESETVVVEWMPEHLRASHSAAGNRGAHPHNGSIRIRCERTCAATLVEDADGWAEIVSDA